MYKAFSAKDFLAHQNLPETYKVSGFLIYGTFRKYPYELAETVAKELYPEAVISNVATEFLESILEIKIGGKVFWFVTAYGGALLSEWVHLACLFGSKSNVVLGSCGGLQPEGNMYDIIVPTYSYGDESTTRAYNPDTNKHFANEALSKKLIEKIKDVPVWEGPIITYQAMLAETWEDVERWSKEGYRGVEMEVATVFAVSKHFNVPAAAVLHIGDNLIKKETVAHQIYKDGAVDRKRVSTDMLKVAFKTAVEYANHG